MEGGSMDKIQLMGVAFSLILMFSVFLLVRERMIREKYSLVWLLIALFTMVMSLFRELMDWFAGLIGVFYAPSAFFAMLIACAYLLLLNMSVSISSLKAHNKALTQELGLAKLRLEELEKRVHKAEI